MYINMLGYNSCDIEELGNLYLLVIIENIVYIESLIDYNLFVRDGID